MAKIATLQNAFNANINGFDDNSVSTGTASIVSEQLQLKCGSGSGQHGSIRSATAYDFVDSAAYVRLDSLPGSGRFSAYFMNDLDLSADWYEIRVVPATTLSLNRIGSVEGFVTVYSGAYDPATHPWLKFAVESDGANPPIVRLSKAADNGNSPDTFSSLGSESVPATMDALWDAELLEFQLQSRYTGTNNQIVVLEAFNTDVGGGGASFNPLLLIEQLLFKKWQRSKKSYIWIPEYSY